ncbi:MAG: hypothetical protein Q4P30_02430 [Eubacteriales bacterium]|nr:hypothetical protein [Eubacteriales bacterium]
MKKTKLFAGLLVATMVLGTGCSAFDRAVGNVTEETLRETSFMTYGKETMSDEIGRMFFYAEELGEEVNIANSGMPVEGMWAEKANEASDKTREEVAKERAVKKGKEMLALLAHAKDYDVSLTQEEKDRLTEVVKTQLGQTYKNNIVDFFASKGVNLTEEAMIEFYTKDMLAGKVRKKAIEAEQVNEDFGKVVLYDQIIVPVQASEGEARSSAEKMLEELKGGKGIQEVAQAAKMAPVPGVIAKNVPADTMQGMDIPLDKVLNMKEGDADIMEVKQGDVINGFIVVQVREIDTEQAKKELVSKAQSLVQKREEAFNERLGTWTQDVYVNEEKLASISFQADTDYWEKYKQVQQNAPVQMK